MASNLVVDPYGIRSICATATPPKALREAIRAAGPTVRRDLGKQALGLKPRSGARAAKEGACIVMTISTPHSSPLGSNSFATRSGAGFRAN